MLSCGRAIQETTLHGYDKGKKIMQLEYRIFNVKLDNGKQGKRLESSVHYALGNRKTVKTNRVAWLHENFSLYKTEASSEKNKEISTTKSWTTNEKIFVENVDAKGKHHSHEIDLVQPVFIELHPLLYLEDLKTPGTEKIYPILREEEGQIVNLTVKFDGPKTITIKDKVKPCLLYRIQAVTNPDEYDNYYIDPKTRNIAKIQLGSIKFIPADS